MFKRIWNFIKGTFATFIGALESSNPQAMLEAEKDNINQQLVEFNAGLVNQAAMIEGMTRQIKELEEQTSRLTVHVTQYAKSGDMAAAGRVALQLETAQTQLNQLLDQRKAANIRLVELERSRDAAFARVREKMAKMQQMVNETKMINVQTDLETSARSMVTATTTSLDGLGRVEGRIAEMRDQAVGRARIAAGQANNPMLMDETQSHLEAAALQRFLGVSGVHATGAESVPPVVEKNLGTNGEVVVRS